MNIQKEPMIALGPTQVRVSPMGVGTNSWGLRRAADPGKLPAFKALMGAGVNLFDTAEIYTLGASERTLGHCIGASGTTPVVLTKFFPLPWRWRKQDLPGALHASLARLGLAKVDVYLLHYPLPPVALETWADALADAAHAGLARAVGISNCNAEQTRRAHAALAARGVSLVCNEVEFSLLKRDPQNNGLLSVCRELDVTLIAYRPLAMGVLTGKYSTKNPPKGARAAMFSRRYLAGLAPLISAMARIGENHGGKSASQVAINWVMCKGALPIPGVKDLGQALQNTGALGWRLSEEEIAELEAAAP
ncbi:MAG: aldo/keto reductase [Spirochaetia bacterium]|jgi:aryl-alcohol dehydrogenase-like predicted oxidoreductase